MRWLVATLALTGCIEVQRTGYVLRSASVGASPGEVNFTLTFDNYTLPESGQSCIGIEVCNETVE